MITTPATAQTPRELARLPQPKAFLYNLALRFLEVTGSWRYPVDAQGDYEAMGTRDILYWLHKAKHHVLRAEPGSRLEEFFAHQPGGDYALPEGFETGVTLSLSAAGDLMNHEYLVSSPGLYDAVESEIFDADISMANLECVVLDKPSEEPQFDGRRAPRLRLDRAAFDAVAGGERRRFSFLAAACNHTLDFGMEGVRSTVEALRLRGIASHGINATAAEADKARIIERKGVRLAILSHTFGLNGWKPPEESRWLVNRTRLNDPLERIDLTSIHRQLAHARDAGAEFVIAQLHWGMEFEHFPRQNQIEVAHAIAEAGVDALFGHHPHVIQPVEHYRTRRDPERVVPIFYSLGNLTNPFRDPRLCRSLIARLDLARGRRADGREAVYLRRAEAITLEQHLELEKRQITLKPVVEAE